MALAFFYNSEINIDTVQLVLNEETSKHIVQVLRMQNGEQLQITDGKGNLFTTTITDNNRKRCEVAVINTIKIKKSKSKISIAISLIKNASRFEWFLEKATEMGVAEIIPIICTRTEKQQLKFERMQGILISAMLQSQQCWLPVLQEPIKLNAVINQATTQQKLIAHCEVENNKIQVSSIAANSSEGKLILIGPEGDFTTDEITSALQNNFIPVSLGNTRLRTETAGIAAAALLCLV